MLQGKPEFCSAWNLHLTTNSSVRAHYVRRTSIGCIARSRRDGNTISDVEIAQHLYVQGVHPKELLKQVVRNQLIALSQSNWIPRERGVVCT